MKLIYNHNSVTSKAARSHITKLVHETRYPAILSLRVSSQGDMFHDDLLRPKDPSLAIPIPFAPSSSFGLHVSRVCGVIGLMFV